MKRVLWRGGDIVVVVTVLRRWSRGGWRLVRWNFGNTINVNCQHCTYKHLWPQLSNIWSFDGLQSIENKYCILEYIWSIIKNFYKLTNYSEILLFFLTFIINFTVLWKYLKITCYLNPTTYSHYSLPMIYGILYICTS